MTISEYYENYSTTKRFPNQLPNGNDSTIDDFYRNCIAKNLCSKQDVLAWHDMLMEYVEMDDAVLWVRYYESGPKVNSRFTTRRACYTAFEDGFSYSFVSNFDVHEIFNMVFQGVTPNKQEFLDLMKSFKYPLHYDKGVSCEESSICAYPNIGSPKGGVLTVNHWYLAHINAIKGGYLRPDGTVKKISKQEKERLYPKGSLSDWQKDPKDGIMTRKLNYSLSQDEKALVKAHFLRFVDPLNYFIVPGVKYETNDVCYNIGEYDYLTTYVSYQYESIYGKKAVNDFCDKALICAPCYSNIANIDQDPIEIKYGSVQIIQSNPKNTRRPSKRASSKPRTVVSSTGRKVGVIANNDLRNVLTTSSKVTFQDIKDLQDKGISKTLFGINFPVLDVSPAEKNRYYAQPVVINGKQYYLCSQWYDRHKQKLENWINTH